MFFYPNNKSRSNGSHSHKIPLADPIRHFRLDVGIDIITITDAACMVLVQCKPISLDFIRVFCRTLHEMDGSFPGIAVKTNFSAFHSCVLQRNLVSSLLFRRCRPKCKHPHHLHCSLLGGLCYANALQGAFVFDDDSAVVRNPDVCAPALSLAALLSHDFWGMPLSSSRSHKSFRPLTTLSFRANCRAHGLGSPLGPSLGSGGGTGTEYGPPDAANSKCRVPSL